MHTTVTELTAVVNLDDGYDCPHHYVVVPLDVLLARIDEVLAKGTFRSEREWCRKAGVSQTYIAAIRSRGGSGGTGEVKDVKREQVVRLARAAGLDPAYLLGEETIIPPTKVSLDGSVDEAIRGFEWPGDLSAAQADEVIARARDEAREHPGLPVKFWLARLGRLAHDAKERVAAKSRVRKTTGASR